MARTSSVLSYYGHYFDYELQDILAVYSKLGFAEFGDLTVITINI